MKPNYAQARRHATRRLMRELSHKLSYHNLGHTLDVIERCIDLGELIGISDEQMLLVKTAAAYHDIGFLVKVQGHEALGAQMAGEVLGGFGYSAEQIHTIQALIMATKLGHEPSNMLEKIMSDADLDILGRPDFLARSGDLHTEVVAMGEKVTTLQWYTQQHRFLSQHQYQTDTAHQLRKRGKAMNIGLLAELIEEQD